MSGRYLNRREFLKVSALLGGTAILAACAPKATPTSPPKKEEAAPTVAKATAPPKVEEAAGELEIFSWWTSGGEVEALNGLFRVYGERHPQVEIINAALAGGSGAAGAGMKAVLKTRMLGGEPPDSFQVHLGHELIDTHVVADRMEPLDALYEGEGWVDVFPPDVVQMASWQGKPWSVPVNIHRSNCFFYNLKMFENVSKDPPATWDEFFEVGEAMKAKDQALLGIAGSGGAFSGHVFETMLMATFDPDSYRGLFTGKTSWEDERVTEALEIFKRALDYSNPDYASVGWGDINDLMVSGRVAVIIQGDWTPGVLWSKDFHDFGWVASPGTTGIYGTLSDSFGLPKGAPNRENAINWLRVVGSKEGQDAFNPAKGSIPARTDPDLSLYTEYHKDAMADFAKDELVPSVAHGTAAKESFMTDYVNVFVQFIANKDVDVAQAELVEAAEDAEFSE